MFEKDKSNDQVTQAVVESEMEDARQFSGTLELDEVKSGAWFLKLLQKVVQGHERADRAAHFGEEYPDLSPDEIADKIIALTMRRAALAGGIAGAAATAQVAATLGSFGLTAPLLLGTIGAEMIYLARLQMNMVLDLAVIYEVPIDADDASELFMIFGYALGLAPVEMAGKGFRKAAGTNASRIGRHAFSKGRIDTFQTLGQRLGVQLLQKKIMIYAAVVASAALGSSYNYATTKSVGNIAKAHFKNRGKVTDELRQLVSHQTAYDVAFPAAVLFLAGADGEISTQEKEMYRAMLTQMDVDAHTHEEFQTLANSQDHILEAIAEIEDDDLKNDLLEVLILMAAYDGELAEEERAFLANVAEQFHVPLPLEKVEQLVAEYQTSIQLSLLEKTKRIAREAITQTGGRVKKTMRQIMRRPAADTT